MGSLYDNREQAAIQAAKDYATAYCGGYEGEPSCRQDSDNENAFLAYVDLAFLPDVGEDQEDQPWQGKPYGEEGRFHKEIDNYCKEFVKGGRYGVNGQLLFNQDRILYVEFEEDTATVNEVYQWWEGELIPIDM
jgi:hypothetical protein